MGGSTATNMSRRTFLGAATVAGVQLAVFGLAGCAPSAQGESGKAGGFTAGTYTGEAEGKFDAVVVETDFTEDSIAAVRVVKSGDTARIEQPAIEKMPERIVDAQGLGVDTVTGSTLTSMAILNAVSSCVEQAGGSVSALKKKGASEPSGEHVDLEADVVVVGAGASGMGGAIAAAQGGKRVIVLEKNSNIGGNCLVSGGYLEYLAAPDDARPAMTPELERYVEDVLGSEIAAQSNPEVVDAVRREFEAFKASGSAKLFDSPNYYALDFAVTTGEGLPVEAYLPVGKNILALNQWMTENGFEWIEPTFAITGYQYPRWSGPVEGVNGEGYFDFYEDFIAGGTMDIEVYLATAVDELIVENGAVVGVEATAEDGTGYTIKAESVLLASGGFSGNSDMLRQYNTEWEYPEGAIPTTNVNGHTGDGIAMATKLGAGVVDMGNQMMFPFNDPVNFSFEDIMGAFGDSPVVNKDGKRFVDETTDRFTITSELMKQPDSLGFFVCDKKCSDYPSEERQETLLRRGLLYRADTLEELAEQMGCDKGAFVETIEAFNEAAWAGEDETFGRYLFTELSSVEEPPFFASPVTWAAHITIGGLATDENTHEVLTEAGEPIPGLYAAGETRQDICGVGSMADGFAAGQTIASR
ncbi:FAD-dependent oxidoreductase [Raoultibacter massiliensis]|uniref:Urocanate reductase n=1 Tax=Raoultibacter massiliensis TaxID=1852371 RepID=A0ABV1JFH5_9ACTN